MRNEAVAYSTNNNNATCDFKMFTRNCAKLAGKRRSREQLEGVYATKGNDTMKKFWPKAAHVPRFFNADYEQSQFLSGHGKFGQYLQRFGIRSQAVCYGCGEEEQTVHHVLLECPRYSTVTRAAYSAAGFPATNLMAFTETEDMYAIFKEVINTILQMLRGDERTHDEEEDL